MEKKQSSSSSSFFSFKRLSRKPAAAGGGEGERVGQSGGSWRWKYLKASAGLRWKRRFNLHLWLVDGVLFKIVSIFEAIVLVSTLCAFFVCCGCHF